ncbi:uncharacterized protein LOC122498315 [Leptopilina heterotoma]|uniref:uncharacterized protein LOC122498315 n=1 Tax=Leptopilina heterotoma TaxID=63436 RepID=UPI001CA8710E|nr:uncharacterized protein LOC122498315 [Leptopilina heterotoma]
MQLTQDEKHRLPLGAYSLENHAYVDECFCGAHELELAVRKRDKLCNILLSAGIELDKWSANCTELLPPQTKSASLENDRQIARTESVKTLGLHWNPKKDAFEFSFTKIHSQSYVLTKRSVLSIISQLFDPLGWLAPIIITAKILMQDLWILKCDRDSPLPPDVLRRWHEYSSAMFAVSNITINRWLGTLPSSGCHLHGFADASSRANAAAVYLKVSLGDKETHISVLTAKTKVSPVKTISIPNLELNAAALLVKLICYVRKLPGFNDFPVFSWSDSQVVLSWLRKHPCHWKTFVANRVAFIQTELPSAEWRHVTTKDNPADLATRGVKPTELSSKEIWWNGPKWLSLTDENWPQQPETSRSLHVVNQYNEPEILSRFSNLSRLIRVVAYCRRFFVTLRDRVLGKETNTSFLMATELMQARHAIIRLAQTAAFSAEIEHLKTKESLPKRNLLRKMNPFVGDDGILRVGGRLHHSSLAHEMKHPPILPYRSALSRLFMHQAHLSSLHGGLILTTSFLLQNVWIT